MTISLQVVYFERRFVVGLDRGAVFWDLDGDAAARTFAAVGGSVVVPVSSSRPISGSFCLSLSTGSKRSPSSSARFNPSSEMKTNLSGSPFLRQSSTSCQVTGVEIVGRSLARGE